MLKTSDFAGKLKLCGSGKLLMFYEGNRRKDVSPDVLARAGNVREVEAENQRLRQEAEALRLQLDSGK